MYNVFWEDLLSLTKGGSIHELARWSEFYSPDWLPNQNKQVAVARSYTWKLIISLFSCMTT